MATPGRKAYPHAGGFLAACRRYIRSISYMSPVMLQVPEMTEDEKTGKMIPLLDSWGHPIYREEPLIAEDGKPAVLRKWTEAPSVTGCQLHLGLSRQAWSEYARQAGYAEACEWVRMLVEQYNIQQLGGKGAAGAKFTLEHNFGWKERREVSVDERTAKAITTAGMDTADKMRLAMELFAAGDDDGACEADGG